MLFSGPPAGRGTGGDFFKKPAGIYVHKACTGSNQLGSDGPGLPASPQPGLMGTGWVDDVFFGEKHGVDGLGVGFVMSADQFSRFK
jgi:hypothetical protein